MTATTQAPARTAAETAADDSLEGIVAAGVALSAGFAPLDAGTAGRLVPSFRASIEQNGGTR